MLIQRVLTGHCLGTRCPALQIGACVDGCKQNVGAQTLDEAGGGRVIVVDGQASKRCALLGDLLGAKLLKNGFAVRRLMPTICCTAKATPK